MDASQGSRKALLLVFLVFALGIALGAVSTYMVTTRVHADRTEAHVLNPANTVAKLTVDLKLSPDQRKQIESILSDSVAGYAALHDKLDPEYEKVRQQGRERIRQVLTPEQRPQFEDFLRQMDEERRRRQAEAQRR
jgi:hypothetical protein